MIVLDIFILKEAPGLSLLGTKHIFVKALVA
jgi:hypothetical protein